MKRWLWTVVVVLAVGGGIWWAVRALAGDEQKVRRCFSRLSELINKHEGESLILAAARGQALGNVFTDDFEAQLELAEFSGHFSPEEIVAHAVRARSQFKQLELRFADLQVRVLPKGREAEAAAVATLSGRSQSGADWGTETRLLRCRLRKGDDGHWRFAAAELTQGLAR